MKELFQQAIKHTEFIIKRMREYHPEVANCEFLGLYFEEWKSDYDGYVYQDIYGIFQEEQNGNPYIYKMGISLQELEMNEDEWKKELKEKETRPKVELNIGELFTTLSMTDEDGNTKSHFFNKE